MLVKRITKDIDFADQLGELDTAIELLDKAKTEIARVQAERRRMARRARETVSG
jgi:hypothetical protein